MPSVTSTTFAPVYQNAPTFAYRIGEYTVSKYGTLTGPNDEALCNWLLEEGFFIKQQLKAPANSIAGNFVKQN